MLDSSNVFYVARAASQLLNGPKFTVSRALRRFLADNTVPVVPDMVKHDVIQSFAFEQGYNVTQLDALEAYATKRVAEQAEYLAEVKVADAVSFTVTARDNPFGLVSNNYQLAWNPATASLKELQRMVLAVAVLANAMHRFAHDINKEVLFDCPIYRYRGLPCSIEPDDKLWMVSGRDQLNGGGGVLEWCFDQTDAEERMALMARFPERFTMLDAAPFLSTPAEATAAA